MSVREQPHIMILGVNIHSRGAEAMMITVRDAIGRSLPDAVFCAPLPRRDEADAYRRHGVLTIQGKAVSGFLRYYNALGRYLGFSPRDPVDPRTIGPEGIINVYRVSDVVVDVSGFASGDQWGPRMAVGRWKTVWLAKMAKNRLVFMPQSWGPFENRRTASFTRRTLAKADLIYAREQTSLDHLLGLGGLDRDKVRLAPDIAFQFQPSPPEVGRRLLAEQGLDEAAGPILGITPNMQLYERTPGERTDNVYVRFMVQVIREILSKTECQIALIPHEVYGFRPDDRAVCGILEREFEGSGRLRSLSGQESAADLKAAIGRMEFLIASRYHSLVAALSLRVPVAVVGWAHKYDELMRQVGIAKFAVDPVRRPDEASPGIILEAWNQRHAIRAAEAETVPRIEELSAGALEKMVQVVRS